MEKLVIYKKTMYLLSVLAVIVGDIIFFMIFFKLIGIALLDSFYLKIFVFIISLCFFIISIWLLTRILYMLKAFISKIPLIKLDSKGIYYDSILGMDFVSWEECKGYNFQIFNYQSVIHIEMKDYNLFYKKMKFSQKCVYKFNARAKMPGINLPAIVIGNRMDYAIKIISSKLNFLEE